MSTSTWEVKNNAYILIVPYSSKYLTVYPLMSVISKVRKTVPLHMTLGS